MNQNYPPRDGRSGDGKTNFWTSLPGILTGAAALVGSIGGLVGALFAAGVIGGDGGANDPVIGQPTATAQVTVATPTTQVVIATATTAPFVAEAPQEVQIEGIWFSQGGFSWDITQNGNDVEIASLDILGTTYLGTRTGDFIQINSISDGFSVVPTTGSMRIEPSGDVMSVVIGGVPDTMIRQ